MRRINAIALLYAFLMLWLCSCSQTVQKTGEDVAKNPISFAQEPIIFSEEKSPEYNMEKHERRRVLLFVPTDPPGLPVRLLQ